MNENRNNTMPNNERFILLESVIGNINTTLTRLDNRLDILDNDMKQGFRTLDSDIKQNYKDLNNNYKDLNNRLWTNFIWLLGAMMTLAGLIAHTQHWL